MSQASTISSREEASTPLQWKFSQVFGERSPTEEIQDGDVVSAIEFDESGDHIAVGDRGGRVVIFESKGGKHTGNQHLSRNEVEQMDSTSISTMHPQYQYKTEFQSHQPEFDYLRSLEIEEKVNRVRWCRASNGSRFILSTNNKTIKLWKVKDRKVKKVKEMDPHPHVSSENTLLAERSFVSGVETPLNGYHLEWTEKMSMNTSASQETLTSMANNEDSAYAMCRRAYAHAHDFNINSISENSDGETFISADDLRINLWNLEISDQCFNIIDMKPPNMDDLTEVITSAEFHPIQCNLLAYGSSRGFIRLVDMRQSALCDHTAKLIKDSEAHAPKSFFTEIIASISDIKFANDGRHLLTRDYMNLKLWDVQMDSRPVAIFKIHENLRPKLSDLYNNDSIFDKFECCVSRNGFHFATGSYSNLLRIFSSGAGNAEGITIEATKNDNRKPLLQPAPRTRRSSFSNLTLGLYRPGNGNSSSGNEYSDLSSKLLHVAWHPKANLIASASGNSLFLHHA